ncbi:MAG: MutS protein msh5, partial [Pleopsidium flavum]
MPLAGQTGDGTYEGGDDEEERWDKMFTTGLRAYYKDYRMREMDETFGDMYALICDKEIEIVHELAQKVLEYEALLTVTSDICGELDSLLALVQGARMYKLTRPRITEENIIRIKGGRHPLQELTVPSYVANDAFLVGGPGSEPLAGTGGHENTTIFGSSQLQSIMESTEGPSMLMMTGPNYSGKSVYLKQIALIVYMAHIGSFVPADGAKIGLTDKILTRIATRETVSKMQSAFMIDLQQVALATSLATRRSLVIIDEF